VQLAPHTCETAKITLRTSNSFQAHKMLYLYLGTTQTWSGHTIRTTDQQRLL